jgi:hypothetical protein
LFCRYPRGMTFLLNGFVSLVIIGTQKIGTSLIWTLEARSYCRRQKMIFVMIAARIANLKRI